MLWVSSLHEWIKYRDFCEISMIFSEILTFVFFAISRFFLLKMLLLVFAMNTRYLSGFLKTFLFSVRDFPVLLPLYFLWIFEGFFLPNTKSFLFSVTITVSLHCLQTRNFKTIHFVLSSVRSVQWAYILWQKISRIIGC